MENTSWFKQPDGKPLYPDLIWSRPEAKHSAGKLLIIGGNIHSFSAVGQAFRTATEAQAGVVRIILPDSLQKTVSKILPEADFAPSTPSGSFSQLALGEFINLSTWSDGVLISGDLGRNSETSILLEKFVTKYHGQLTIAKDAVDYFTKMPLPIINRPQTCLVLTMAQLQLIASSLKLTLTFSFEMGLIQLVENLINFSQQTKISLVLKHLDTFFVADNGQVSTTKTDLKDEDAWRISTAASAAVWWLQNPTKTFEALTTSVVF